MSDLGITSPARSQGRGVWHAVGNAVETVLAVVVVILLVVAIALAVLVRTGPDGESVILGHPVFSVASGSMTPTFDTGDLIIDQPLTLAQAGHLHKGQIISFEETSAATRGAPLIITHRIYAVTLTIPGTGVPTPAYTTKGDANNAPDAAPVAPTAILGLYQARIPFGGYILSALHQPITFILLILIPVVYLVFTETRRRWIALGVAARDQSQDPRGRL